MNISITQSSFVDEMETTTSISLPAAQKERVVREREKVGSFLHLGAGVQSSTLAQMIVEGDLPLVDAVIFADTGDEPRHVYENVNYLKDRLDSVGIPLLQVKRNGSAGLMTDYLAATGRFVTLPLYTYNPETKSKAILRRQCTDEYKIVPCEDALLTWLMDRGYAFRNKRGSRRVSPRIKIENLYGISADEKHRQRKRGQEWQEASYPLIDMNMTRQGCVAYLLSKGLPVPKKSSCIMCPYHDDVLWLDMKETQPEEFERACKFDDSLRDPLRQKQGGIVDQMYVHPSRTPLRTVDFAERIKTKSLQHDMFKDELFGATCSTDGGFTCFS